MKVKLSNSQKAVIECLKKKNRITYDELVLSTGLSYSGIRSRISELVKKGFNITRERLNGITIIYYSKDKDLLKKPIKPSEKYLNNIKSIEDFYNIVDFLNTIKIKKSNIDYKNLSKKIAKKDFILVLSDIHLGEIIKDSTNGKIIYNIDICKQRMQKLTTNLLKILKEKGATHLNIALLGDMIDGDMIYKNHTFNIEKSAIEQVKDVVEILNNMFNTLIENGIKITTYCVRGNHGVTNYHNLEEDNWDNVVYKMLDIIAEHNNNLTINHFMTPEGMIKIKDKKILILHGDVFGDQIKTSAGLKYFRGLCTKHNLLNGDLVLVGHYHTFGIEYDQGKILIRNGSIASTSPYAFSLNLFSVPEQTLLVVDKSHYPLIIPIEL